MVAIQFILFLLCKSSHALQSVHIPRLNSRDAAPDALLVGVETRSSSPVRIVRDASYRANILGIYPGGEGAGYAGGIMSAAIDGLRIAGQLISEYRRP